MSTRVLVIGWDAATHAHLDAFDLPFYESLDYGGTLLPEPFWQSREIDSGSAWTTITTGHSMWDHQVATLTGRIEHPRRLQLFSQIDHLIPRNIANTPARIWARRLTLGDQPTNEDISYKRVWHYLPNSLAFAVPLTYPPKPTDGVTISGFPSPEVTVQPSKIEDDVREHYDGEPERKFAEDGIREGYIDDLFETHQQELDTVLWLNEKREFTFQFVVFTLLDRLLHVTDPYDSAIQRAYEEIDETTARLVDAVNPDEVLLVSDHGMKHAPRWRWRHIHDETSGMWAGTRDFGLETHLDVTPAILDCYGKEVNDDHYEGPASAANTEKMEDRLKDLGYL
jgi:hypothetical protein